MASAALGLLELGRKKESRGEGLSVIDLNCVPYLHVKKMGGGDEGDV